LGRKHRSFRHVEGYLSKDAATMPQSRRAFSNGIPRNSPPAAPKSRRHAGNMSSAIDLSGPPYGRRAPASHPHEGTARIDRPALALA